VAAKSFICGVEGLALNNVEKTFLSREQPYGVILFARNIADPSQLKALVADIKSCLTHPFTSVLIDQEGGRVARMRPPHWRAYPPAQALAAKENATRVVYVNARMIAEELASMGITTDCAPLADVLAPECHAIIGDRAFGEMPDTVATLARAQADGLRDGGILPVLKHIPGHGRATQDSHEHLPVVSATLGELATRDFVPFHILADLPLGMTAHIIYEALDPERCATLSPIVIDFIRREIGFDGLLMSDDLSMKALTGPYTTRAEHTLKAGCDLVLHCNGKMDEMIEVARASTSLAGDGLRRAQAAANWLPAKIASAAPLHAEWQSLVA
jgi:beta-N-acetylhexosaminidase